MSQHETYAVVGMTCGHCVAAVTEQIEQIGGVTSVDVDLASGAVEVVADRPLRRDEVEAAVVEAGYALAP